MNQDDLRGARLPAALRARWWWLLLALTVPAVYPALAYNIAATAYDAATVHIYQGVVFSNAISDGVLYPRWVQFLHWGLGSPLFTFRAPLPYYLMDLLSRIGLPHPLGWRVIMAAGLLAACVGAYLLVFSLTRQRWASVLAGVVFLYAPYVLRNTFERGSPETISLFLSPWVLWTLVRLAQQRSVSRFLLATILWALCITAHVLGPLMLAPVAALVGIVIAWRYRTWAPLAALLAGGLLTAFVWAPMIPEQSFVHIERDFSAAFASPLQNPLSLDQLLAPPALYDTGRDNNTDDERLGLVHLLILLLGIPAAVVLWRKGQRQQALILTSALAVGLILIWMLTGAADPVWRVLKPLLERLQYRSRLDGLQALAVAVVAGLSLTVFSRRWQPRIAGVVLSLVVLSALPSLYVNLRHHYAPFGDSLTLSEVRTAEIRSGGSAFTTFGEFEPRWREAPFDQALQNELGPMFDAAAHPLAAPVAGVTVESAQVRSSAWDVTLSAANPVSVTLHLLYYPRWQATVDGTPAALQPQPKTGYAQVVIPAGTHQLALRYGSTATERAGILISGATLLVLLVLAAGVRVRPRRGKPKAEVSDRLSSLPASEPASGAPALWALVGLTVLLAFKIFYVDGHTTWLRCVSTADQVCGAQATTDVAFNEGHRLRGYSISTPSVAPGGTFKMSLTWQGVAGTRPQLYSFVHIRNSRKDWPVNPETGSDIWAQSDHVAPGDLLTTDWVPDKLYRDDFQFSIPAGTPPGTYYLEVGWFDAATSEQLDPQADTLKPPLKVLWRSVLLPSIEVK
jgi:hypothetical protein